MDSKKKKYMSVVIIALLVLLTIFLRFPMLKYGMPFDLGDEDENGFIGCALNYGATHSLKPILTWYPAFYSYVLAAAYGIYFLTGSLTGDISGTTEFAVRYLMWPGYFHFIGRLLSIFFTAGCVILIYESGRRFQDEITGLIAAAMFTLSTTVLIRSSWALPDATYLLMTTLTIFFLFKYLETNKTSFVILSGLFCGLAIATKYNTGTLILVGASGIALNVWSRHADSSMQRKLLKLFSTNSLYLFGILTCIGFFVGTPYFIFNIYTHLTGLSWEIGRLGSEQGGSSAYLSNLTYIWIISEFVVWERGIGVFALAGLAYGIYRWARGDKRYLLFMPYLLVTFLMIGRYQKHSLHYLLPTFPALFLVSGRAFRQIMHGKYRLTIIFSVLAFTALIVSGERLLSYRTTFTKKDSRIAAREWILDNIPNGSRIAIGRTINSPPLPDLLRFDKARYSMIGEQVISKKIPVGIKKAYAKEIGDRYYILEHYIAKKSEGRGESYSQMMGDFEVLDINRIGPEPPDYIIYSSYDLKYFDTKRIPESIGDTGF